MAQLDASSKAMRRRHGSVYEVAMPRWRHHAAEIARCHSVPQQCRNWWLSLLCVFASDLCKTGERGLLEKSATHDCRVVVVCLVWHVLWSKTMGVVYSLAVASATCFFPFSVLDTCLEPRCSSSCSCVFPCDWGLSSRFC